MSVRVHFQDVAHSERIREECEESAASLQDEFPETAKYEITLTHAGDTHEAHVHVSGRDVSIASTGQGDTIGESLGDALEKARRQLRKHHDKQIFARRRDGGRNAS